MSRSSRSAFTITELLIAVAVASILVVMTVSLYSLIKRSIVQDQTKADLSQNARVVLDRLSRELRQSPQIVTQLPTNQAGSALVPQAVPIDANTPQPNEIEFRDGHANDLTYKRYFLSGTTAEMQVKEYYFAGSPGVRVLSTATDGQGNPPVAGVISTQDVAENVKSMTFSASGTAIQAIIVTSDGGNQSFSLETSVVRRN